MYVRDGYIHGIVQVQLYGVIVTPINLLIDASSA